MSGYYVKGATRGTTPGRLVSVVCTERVADRGAVAGMPVPTVLDRVYVAHAGRDRGKYGYPQTVSFGEPERFWGLLEGSLPSRGRVVIVSPNAGECLTLLRMWDRWTDDGAVWKPRRSDRGKVAVPDQAGGKYQVGTRALHGRPDILEYTVGKVGYGWYGLKQYLDLDDEDLADATGFDWPGWDKAGAAGTHPKRSPADRCLLYLHAAERYADWWASLRAGPWPRTTAAAAGMFLRSRAPKKTLCTHDCPLAWDLERRAAHSGRATVWCYAHVTPAGRATPRKRLPFPPSPYPPVRGPIHHYDFSSMFPALLSRERFPCKLSHVSDRVTVASLRDHLSHFLAIAHVRLKSECAEYPHREAGKVIYPAGTFTATLTTPELQRALAAGEIVHVYEAAYYFGGHPYQAAANELLALRKRYKAEGNDGWEMMVKLLANSMTGRLNQRPTRWVPKPDVWPPLLWGQWYSGQGGGGPVRTFRATAGVVEEQVRDLPAPGTLAAGYCHLTAYSRCLMRTLRETLPPRSVFHQDTDGIWVTSIAGDMLGQVVAEQVGASPTLRLTGSTRFARFLAPKHYYHDGGWVAAGLSDPRIPAGSACYTASRRVNPARGSTYGPPHEIYTVDETGTLDPPAPDGVIGPDGWIEPPLRPRHGLRGGGGGGLFDPDPPDNPLSSS